VGRVPSLLHAVLKLLFEDDRGLVLDLLEELGVDVSGLVVGGFLSTTSSVPELASDACIRLVRPDGTDWVIVVEIQLRPDRTKELAWPCYEAEAARRGNAPASVLVVTVNEVTERWARSLRREGPSGSRFVPFVVGPAVLAERSTSFDPVAHPALAIVASLAFPADVESAKRAARGLRELDEANAVVCYDLLATTLEAAARRSLEELMIEGFKPQSALVKKLWNEVVESAQEEGRTRGLEEGQRAALVKLLVARGFAPDEAQRARIDAADLPTLELWFTRAVTAARIDDVLL